MVPRVSVIIPTYNRAKMVVDAIASVLNQSFADFELLIVDDGSTDNTEAVVRNFPDPRLRLIQQTNQGVSAARNAGLKVAKGDLIALLDSDDHFLPDKLTCQMAALEDNPTAGLVYGRYYTESASGIGKKLLGNCDGQIGLEQLMLGPAFHTSTLLIRRSWLDKVGGFDEQLSVGEEWELALRLVLAGCPMICVPQPVSEVRLRADSLTHETYRHSKSVTAVLDKIFNRPEMPEELRQKRELFYGSLFIRHAVSAYLAPDPEVGKELLKKALYMVDLTLNKPEADLLIGRFVSHLKGYSKGSAEMSLRFVSNNLPGDNSFSKKLNHKLWERYYLESAFLAFSNGNRIQCIHYSLRTFMKSPGYLQNRGLVSILIRSLIGNGVAQ